MAGRAAWWAALRPRLPGGVAGQIAVIVVAALILAQFLTASLLVALHSGGEPPPPPHWAAGRIGAIVQLIDSMPAAARASALMRLGPERPTLHEEAPFPGQALNDPHAEHLLLNGDGGGPGPGGPGGPRGPDVPRGPGGPGVFGGPGGPGRPPGETAMPMRIREIGGERRQLAVRLHDGSWIQFDLPPVPSFTRGGPGVAFLGVTTIFLGVTIAALSIWATRRVTAPLRRLAEAADQLGLEGAAPALQAAGPNEVRRAAHAFNAMQERLRRIMADRTRMLAAIGHDLRTPLTRLRLRIETLLEDSPQTPRLLQDLATMEAMLDSSLSLLRGQGDGELVEPVELPALLQTLCDEFADTGADVRYEGPDRGEMRCRPLALTRAMNNLVENALKFAGQARVELALEPASALIRVSDDGAGIAPGDLAKVFEPFFRGDRARSQNRDDSRDGGPSGTPQAGGVSSMRLGAGVGLGLSIARDVIHAHGGEIRLVNRGGGGLTVEIRLPRGA